MNQSVTMNTSTSSSYSYGSGASTSSTLNGFTWPTLSRAIVCAFAILTCFINITVFVHPKLKDPSYKYMLVISISNFFYTLFQFIYTITSTCLTCATLNSYFVSFFLTYFIIYAAGVLSFFRITVECAVALNTYCILTNRNRLTRISYKLTLPILFLIAASLYSVIPIGINIGSFVINGNAQYTIMPNSFFFSSFYSIWSIFVNSLPLFLIVTVVTTLNVLNVIAFRKRYRTRIFTISIKNNNTQNTNTMPTISTRRLSENLFKTLELVSYNVIYDYII